VGLIGAMTGAHHLRPDLAVAIDVCHGSMAEGEPKTFPLGKGPTIVVGPNAHPKFGAFLRKVATDLEIPFQIEPAPGPTGTDGWALQVAREGVPTAIIGIPLRYMHTSVETANIKDVERAGRWMAEAIARLTDTSLSEFALDAPSAKEAK
jgi:tetrahedral aminopeptidase